MHRKKISTKLCRGLLAATVTGLAGALVTNVALAQSPVETTAPPRPRASRRLSRGAWTPWSARRSFRPRSPM
ncbi:hypothetical protein HFP43_03285 [Streptomyces sp. SJ1-7]|nr:hypothetical protein [Streptomyces sp. SJ1-7]